MAGYSRDPRWTVAQFPGTCHGRGEAFDVGTPLFFYPIAKRSYAWSYAERAARDFEARAFDDDQAGAPA